MSLTIKTNTLCHQWLGDRYKRGAFDIDRNIMKKSYQTLIDKVCGLEMIFI